MLGSLKRAVQRYLAEVKHATTPRGYSFFQELVLFDFTKEGAVEKWDCISDKDIGGGSHSSLQLNGRGLVTTVWTDKQTVVYCLMHSAGTGVVFSGHLDPTPPLDQSARYSGYCAIRSRPKKVTASQFGCHMHNHVIYTSSSAQTCMGVQVNMT